MLSEVLLLRDGIANRFSGKSIIILIIIILSLCS